MAGRGCGSRNKRPAAAAHSAHARAANQPLAPADHGRRRAIAFGNLGGIGLDLMAALSTPLGCAERRHAEHQRWGWPAQIDVAIEALTVEICYR